MDIKVLLEKQSVRYVLCLLAGVSIGAIFYPTKTVEERVSKKYELEMSKMKEAYSTEKSSLREELTKLSGQYRSYKEQTDSKLVRNLEEIRDLKRKQKTSYYKIVRPDGTVEIKKFSETEVDESTKVVEKIQQEFKVKIADIENKWEQTHRRRVAELESSFKEREGSYQKRISELESTKTVTVNQKRFTLDVGALTTKNYYGHFTMDLWGPLVIGVHGQLGDSNAFGAGIGIRF